MKYVWPSAALAMMIAISAHATPPHGWKAHELAPAEAERWVEAVKNRKTMDGSSVIEALHFAERMRPNEFKIGHFEVGYNGASGEPDGIIIGYYIGLKRSDVDEWTAFFGVKRKASVFYVSVPSNDTGFMLPSEAIIEGRDTLLRFIDEEYKSRCTENGSGGRKLC
ncbi:hypothetical protein [Methylosinus sp. Sm6]|uniref:hypothetical protein n=1 Tax=Methylosinus sp. Sm6 TaxID=2866948 RepID=UPI001C9985A1|nr:hypothetical protein [Methylosinus sp. Sm6]MBY6242804.1 hypothetical protein [Methylosinus sp. Sm6]